MRHNLWKQCLGGWGRIGTRAAQVWYKILSPLLLLPMPCSTPTLGLVFFFVQSTCVLLEALMSCQGVWRFGTMARGALSVTMAGTTRMPLWCASHWDIPAAKRVTAVHLAWGAEGFCWTM